jgi:hypothetical protein
MIEIQGGITIGPGIIIGDVSVPATNFITDTTSDNLISETGDQFVTE